MSNPEEIIKAHLIRKRPILIKNSQIYKKCEGLASLLKAPIQIPKNISELVFQ